MKLLYCNLLYDLVIYIVYNLSLVGFHVSDSSSLNVSHPGVMVYLYYFTVLFVE